ncbi:MAG: dihydrolipoyl dehydrogenase [Aigarchaeota archaeon]|nr:dihydrolipoyl dehydrogenase [Candidatus Pelearchaeum maunauluense]
MTEKYDAVVIGGGPGGYVCAIRLGQLGKKALLVEERELGGECTNAGCIPSKVIISFANKFYEAKKLVNDGALSGELQPSLAKLQEKKDKVIQRLRDGIAFLLKSNGVKIVKGHAELVDNSSVEITTNGSREVVSASSIVIASGTAPTELPSIPFDGKHVISFAEALSLRELPKRLLVVGGGPIGLELGTAYSKLGSEVIIIELMQQLLPGVEPELARIVKRSLERRGVKIHLGTTVENYRKDDDGVRVNLTSGDKYAVDRVLVAVGKRPTKWVEKLRELGVELDGKGFIKVDDRMRTSVDGVYAIGDATGPPFLAHRASRQGIVAAEVIAGQNSVFDNRAVPNAIFTDPEIGSVGYTEAEARNSGFSVTSARFPLSALGRGVLEDETEGVVKIVAEGESGSILGIHIAAPHATELINEAALALEMAATAEDVGYTIHAHPTFAESINEAAHAVLRRAIHLAPR